MKEELLKVVNAVDLTSIRLLSIHSTAGEKNDSAHRISARVYPRAPKLQFFGNVRTLLVGCGIKLISENPEDSFEFSAEFEASYRLKDMELTEEDCEIFAKHNVPFNLWPYFRELIQSVTMRMYDSPVVLPLWRLSLTKQD